MNKENQRVIVADGILIRAIRSEISKDENKATGPDNILIEA